MRKTLFRGKRIIEPIKVDTYAPDGWVYGSLIDCSTEMFIIPSNISGEIYKEKDYKFRANDFEFTVTVAQVDDRTIGQYTGALDKNGNKIFEGDILKSLLYPSQNDKGELNYYFEIVWLEDYCSFGFIIHKNPKSSDNYISDGTIGLFDHFESENWEVIGNIYDNPELIQEEQ